MASIALETNKWDTVLPAVWGIISRGVVYFWPMRKQTKLELAQLLSDEEIARVFAAEYATAINVNLRSSLSPLLTGTNRPKAAKAALWIVKSWGGIKRGEDALAGWSAALGDYNEDRLTAFIEAQGHNRISSWSKLLAFAKPLDHAIYDARTAVALNCALALLGDPRRFHMPASQNKQIRDAREILANTNSAPRGYTDYLVSTAE